MSDDVVIGKFGRPHGVRGEVRFFVYNPESKLIVPGVVLRLVDGAVSDVVLKTVRPADKFLIVQPEGVTDREGAERLSSREASVPRDALPDPKADEFYLVDVIGFEVWAPPTAGADAKLLGQVKGWLDIGPHDIMAITGPEIRGRMLVPNIDHVVDAFDFDQQRVVLHALDTWAAEDA